MDVIKYVQGKEMPENFNCLPQDVLTVCVDLLFVFCLPYGDKGESGDFCEFDLSEGGVLGGVSGAPPPSRIPWKKATLSFKDPLLFVVCSSIFPFLGSCGFHGISLSHFSPDHRPALDRRNRLILGTALTERNGMQIWNVSEWNGKP